MDDITWFEPGWNHENLCFGSGRYFAYCCQILQRDGNHAMGFRFCSWWDEIALVIYPSTCVLGNKTWPHKFHTSLMVMRTQSPNHCHDSTAFDSRMPCNSSPFSTVLSGRSWLVPSELQAASTRHESSGVSVAGFANLKIVDVDILQQLRFVPMDIENWSSIVVICYVRQGVSSQDSCFAFTFFLRELHKTTQRIGMEKKRWLQQRPNLKTFTLALRSCAKGLINMNMVGQRMTWKNSGYTS